MLGFTVFKFFSQSPTLSLYFKNISTRFDFLFRIKNLFVLNNSQYYLKVVPMLPTVIDISNHIQRKALFLIYDSPSLETFNLLVFDNTVSQMFPSDYYFL